MLETRSATAIEQIIGRVLRMPGAAWKKFDALNSGYVFAVSPTPSVLQEELTGALSNAFGLSRDEARHELHPFDAPTLPMKVGEPQTVQVEPEDYRHVPPYKGVIPIQKAIYFAGLRFEAKRRSV